MVGMTVLLITQLAALIYMAAILHFKEQLHVKVNYKPLTAIANIVIAIHCAIISLWHWNVLCAT